MSKLTEYFKQKPTIVPEGHALINIVILNEVVSFVTPCRNISAFVKSIGKRYREYFPRDKSAIVEMRASIAVNSGARMITFLFNEHCLLDDVKFYLMAISKEIKYDVFLLLTETFSNISHRLDCFMATGAKYLVDTIDPEDPLKAYEGTRTTGIYFVDEEGEVKKRVRLYFPEKTSRSVAVGVKLWLNLVNQTADPFETTTLNEFTISEVYYDHIADYCAHVSVKLGEVESDNSLIVAPKSSTLYGKQLNDMQFAKIKENITDELAALNDAYLAKLNAAKDEAE